MMHRFTNIPVSSFLRLLQRVVHVATVWSWLKLTATLIRDCTFSPTVLWAVGIFYPRNAQVFSQQLQETLEYFTTEDGFLHGVLVRITLLAADCDVCLEVAWSDAL